MELWDLYDGNREPLNKVHQRGNRMKPGEFHIVVEIWTVNSAGEILVTLRDPKKELYPDKWENTGGSILAGETSRQGAIRELWEETGIAAREDELLSLGTCRGPAEFFDIYLLRRDIPVNELTMQEGETVDAKWVSADTLDKMIAVHSLALPIGERLHLVRQEFDNFLNSE